MRKRKVKLLPAFFVFAVLFTLCCYIKYTDIKIKALTVKTDAYCRVYEDTRESSESVTLIQYAAPFSYGLQYPRTEQDYVDERIIQIVNKIRADFDEKYRHQKISRSSDNTLLLSYETYIFSVSHISVVFFETHEIDGVSSPAMVHVYHFDLRQNEEQSADDLIYKGFRESASAYAQNYFQETEPYSGRLVKDYRDILATDSGLFDHFVLTHDDILFFIDSGKILSDGNGLIRLAIPYEDMQPKPADYKRKTSREIDPGKPMVALTFDDGPVPVYTNSILDTLEEYDVTATFFDVGQQMEKYPSVSRLEYASGCEVGSHSYSHGNFLDLSDTEIKKDVADTFEIFYKVLGTEPAYFRPPYGSYDDRTERLVSLPFVLWSLDTRDWESRNAEAVMKVIKDTGNLDGHIILMHSIHESSAKATAMLVPYLLEEGYQLVTVSQMIELRGGESPYSYFYAPNSVSDNP